MQVLACQERASQLKLPRNMSGSKNKCAGEFIPGTTSLLHITLLFPSISLDEK